VGIKNGLHINVRPFFVLQKIDVLFFNIIDTER